MNSSILSRHACSQIMQLGSLDSTPCTCSYGQKWDDLWFLTIEASQINHEVHRAMFPHHHVLPMGTTPPDLHHLYKWGGYGIRLRLGAWGGIESWVKKTPRMGTLLRAIFWGHSCMRLAADASENKGNVRIRCGYCVLSESESVWRGQVTLSSPLT